MVTHLTPSGKFRNLKHTSSAPMQVTQFADVLLVSKQWGTIYQPAQLFTYRTLIKAQQYFGHLLYWQYYLYLKGPFNKLAIPMVQSEACRIQTS